MDTPLRPPMTIDTAAPVFAAAPAVRLRPSGETRARAWLIVAALTLAALVFVGYELAQLHSIYTFVRDDHVEASRINNIRELRDYRKARPLVDEVRRDLNAGVVSRTLQLFVESRDLYRFVTLASWKLQATLAACAIVACVFFALVAYYHLVVMPRQASAFERAVEKRRAKKYVATSTLLTPASGMKDGKTE